MKIKGYVLEHQKGLLKTIFGRKIPHEVNPDTPAEKFDGKFVVRNFKSEPIAYETEKPLRQIFYLKYKKK